MHSLSLTPPGAAAPRFLIITPNILILCIKLFIDPNSNRLIFNFIYFKEGITNSNGYKGKWKHHHNLKILFKKIQF